MKSTAFPIQKTHQFFVKKIAFYTLILSTFILSGCAQRLSQQSPSQITVIERAQHLAALSNWKIKGKIAFIQKEKRERANIFWQRNDEFQALKLTTYLGINVLNLTTENKIHTLEVDGKTYQSDNLDQLIWQLTGLAFPSDALSKWMKALPYSENDTLINNQLTLLPESLTSFYNGREWQINYKNYKNFNGVAMPTSLTVSQNGLTIKLAINSWVI